MGQPAVSLEREEDRSLNGSRFHSNRIKKKRPEGRFPFLAGLTGLEPATYGVTGRHSNQLSYNPEFVKTPLLVGDDGLEPPTCCM